MRRMCPAAGGRNDRGAGNRLYATQQAVRKSPGWVIDLDAAKDAEQLIVVAGVDKNTAYVTMHEKDKDGGWQQIIATPGFIGLDGLGDANINDAYTPVGTFTIDRAFGLAEDPGCQMEYTQADDSCYWSGDDRGACILTNWSPSGTYRGWILKTVSASRITSMLINIA